MINKRLLELMGKEKRYVFLMVVLKIVGLLVNIWMIFSISALVTEIIANRALPYKIMARFLVLILLQVGVIKSNHAIGNLISIRVKERLRLRLFDKIYAYGMQYGKNFNMGEVAQLLVNVVENLEVYFKAFLPQLAYSLIAPLILFFFVGRINVKIGLALLAMIPLIPLAIVMVQKLASKVNKKYWGSYVDLSEVFVDFLEGLTSLIIFDADESYNKKLNAYAKKFRQDTMEVLMMQLNNITALDIVAYGGTALGLVLTVYYYGQSAITLSQAIVIILLSSEFFLPLRLLGSFFHVAMNGMGAVDKLIEILDRPQEAKGSQALGQGDASISLKSVDFSYNEDRKILEGVNMEFKKGELIYIVGKSGSGKSTVASLLMNKLAPDKGEILYKGVKGVKEEDILKECTLVSDKSYLFKGSLRYNLQMGNKQAKDQDMWEVLDKLSLKQYFQGEQGLDTEIEEKGNNFSGGQRQRIAIARAMLKDSPVYIFDEATSNIDAESEDIIMDYLNEKKKEKLIIIISHRLKHATMADRIYYMEEGKVKESGNYQNLTDRKGEFYQLYQKQIALENWGI